MAATKSKQVRKADPAKASTAFSIRLRNSTIEELESDLEENPIIGVNSVKLLVKKLAVDFSSGRLVYANPEDREQVFDPDDELLLVDEPQTDQSPPSE